MPSTFLVGLILGSREEFLQKKIHFLGDLKTPKCNSEINWPLLDIYIYMQGSWTETNLQMFKKKAW